mmetsp:Transcript_4752/g.5948  ORF Transcript_4752/g.5948 Transcript_4752/m.5948 type:complete len:115 (-) Transcript_4752:65-409(-)
MSVKKTLLKIKCPACCDGDETTWECSACDQSLYLHSNCKTSCGCPGYKKLTDQKWKSKTCACSDHRYGRDEAVVSVILSRLLRSARDIAQGGGNRDEYSVLCSAQEALLENLSE